MTSLAFRQRPLSSLSQRCEAQAVAAQARAARELEALGSRSKGLQQQLAAQTTAMAELRAASGQQAAAAAAAAAERLCGALTKQRSQLQADFDSWSLQNQAAADDALQQALDSAAEHRQLLMAQAESERYVTL